MNTIYLPLRGDPSLPPQLNYREPRVLLLIVHDIVQIRHTNFCVNQQGRQSLRLNIR